MNFTQRLRETQRRTDSLLCVGLDTDVEQLPTSLRRDARGVLEFNKRMIEATADLVCGYKLNLAFYEALGEAGWKAMRETLRLISKDLISIGDGKRGDIGNTSEQYARSLFDELYFDAVTVNPFMGFDSVEPFIRDESRGAFILALTSNPGSKDFQRLKTGTRPLFEAVVRAASKWNSKKNIGLVVGATHSKDLRRIRKLAPGLPFLIPGVGKQGGDLQSAIQWGCDRNGLLGVINASRSILYASKGKDFASAARNEATKLRDEIRKYQDKLFAER
ncbi:MAG: orotidine-5'-phosphate decarboxylase [Bacteroidota bacterium]